MFALPDTNLFSGVTVTAINVRAQLGAGGQGSNHELELSYQRIGFDGSPIDGENLLPIENCCLEHEMDDFDGLTWNQEHMDSLEIGIEHVTGGEIKLSQIYVVVGYENFTPTVASAIPDTTVLEGTSSVGNYRDLNSVFNDQEEGGALTFTIESNSNPSLVTPSIDADSALDFSFSAGTGSATIVIRAMDSGSNYVEDTMVVNVEVANLDLEQIHFRWRNDDGGEGAGTPDTVEVRVIASTDDAEEDQNGTIDLTSTDLELIQDGSAVQEVGMRFPNITIPQGANIADAYIEFECDETTSVATSVTFWGEDTSNATTFAATDSNISKRTKTSASVAWNSIPAWLTVNEKQQTPDLSPVIQEIVNRGDWSSGNAMVVIVTGSGSRVAEAEDGESSAAALLHVEYQTEFGASWAEDEDSTLTNVPIDSIYRLRLEVSSEGNVADSLGSAYRLEVSEPNPPSLSTTTYTAVPTGSDGHWQIVDSNNLTDGDPTTNVPSGVTDENSTFKAGEVKDTGNQTSAIPMTTSNFTEIEFALKATTNAQDGALYSFRLTDGGDTTDFTHTQYAQAIISGVFIKDIARDTTNGEVTVSWTSVPGTTYDIYYSDSLEGTYSDVDDAVAATYSSSWTDDGSATAIHPDSVIERYYRIQIQGGSVSGNTVGIYAITLQDSAMNLISIPFVQYTTDLDTVIGHQLTGAASELNADRVWKWKPDSNKYEIAWLVNGGGNDGKWWETEKASESDITQDADEGFWIQNRHGTQKLVFSGEVSDTTDRIISLEKGIQLFGSAYPLEVALDSSDLWQDGATGDINELDADRIWQWDPVTDTYKYAWLIDGMGAPYDGKWWDSSTGAETTIRLKPGQGLWFELRDLPGHADFIWSYPKPYTNPPN
jgi:hypothetical protein